MNSNTHDRLKKKMHKKNPSSSPSDEPSSSSPSNDTPLGDSNILEMLAQVNSILKTNPEMISKVNKCVSKIMGNTTLMSKISSEIQNTDHSEVDQALANNSLMESVTALVNESMQ